MANINVCSNKESYDTIKGNPGTFKQTSSLALPPTDVGAVLPKDVALLITTKEDRVENTRLRKGFIHQKGHYITGTVDFETGKLTSLSLPEPVVVHVLANTEQSIEERVNANKLILDSENTCRTKGQVMAM